jgi:nuclear transport factor 2 (NTF2) superfamily protein
MEQRIEQLALKCGAWHQVYGNRNFMFDEHFDIEKFAELIVRECALIADTERSNSIGCGYITKTNGMKIKEHFGVEE